jgi:hypothetical protein
MVIVVVGLLMGAGLLWSLQEEPRDIPLADVVPANTILYVTVPDVEDVIDWGSETGFGQLLQDPEVTEFMAPIWKLAEEPLAELDKNLQETMGVELKELLQMFRGQVSLAVIDVPVDGRGAPDGVMAFGLEDAAGAFPELMDKAMEASGAPMADVKFTIGESPAWRLPGGDVPSIAVLMEGTLFIGTSQERLESIVSSGGQIEGSLSSYDGFQTSWKRTGTRNKGLFGYWNWASFMDFVREMTRTQFAAGNPQQIDEMFKVYDGLGFNDMQDLAMGVTFEDGGFKEHFFIHTPKGRRGIAAWLGSFVAEESALEALVPSTAVQFSRINLDLSTILTGILDIADSAGGREELDEGIARLEERMGMSLTEQVIPSFDKTWISWAMMPPGGLLPDTYSAVNVNDRESFEKLRAFLFDLGGMTVTEISYLDHTIYSSTMDPEQAGAMWENTPMSRSEREMMGMLFGLGFTWVWHEDAFIMCSSPMAAKRFLRSPVPTTTLASTEAYQKVVARVGDPSRGSLSYTDLRPLFTGVYNSLMPLVPFGDALLKSEGVPVDLARLPLGETVADYLGQTAAQFTADNEGLVIETHSSFGAVSVTGGVAATGIVAAIAIPSLMRSRVAANESNAANSLMTLRFVESMWRESDFDGNGVNDFWTGDIAGFYGQTDANGDPLAQIQISYARADAKPLEKYAALAATGTPKSGYLYIAMDTDEDGKPYRTDPDGDGKATTNQNKFAFCANPAD